MDAMHQVHNSENWYIWQEKWKSNTKIILSNTWRKRINITWAYNPISHTLVSSIEELNCNIISTKAIFDKIRLEYNELSKPIHIFLDNAGYQKAYEVQDYAKTLNIILEFLPPYSPNLNLIERFWKFTKKIIVRNKYYENFEDFIQAFKLFFWNLEYYKSSLESLLTFNFEIITNY